MAAASQLACRAGPDIYITLAFHRSPLTRHCLGPRPGGPEVPGATRGMRQLVKTQPGPESPGPGEGQHSSLPWAQGLRPPPCQPLMEEEPTGGQQPPWREGFRVHEVPHAHELQSELLGRAGSSHHSRLTELQTAGHGATMQVSPGTTDACLPQVALNTFGAQSLQSRCP